VETVLSKFGNDQFFDMQSFVEMATRIQWSKNEFSPSLSPEPAPIGAFCFAQELPVHQTASSVWLFSSRRHHPQANRDH
jgi:hypothetical protein